MLFVSYEFIKSGASLLFMNRNTFFCLFVGPHGLWSVARGTDFILKKHFIISVMSSFIYYIYYVNSF